MGWPEDRETNHWLENRGTIPAVEISVDIVRHPPFLDSLLELRDVDPRRVSFAIAPEDEMFRYALEVARGDADQALAHYFWAGLRISEVFLSLAAPAGRSSGAPLRVLDFGSGHGRVTRFLAAALPAGASLAASDIQESALRFVSSQLGVAVRPSSDDPADLHLAQELDAILALSLFTHLRPDSFDAWLRALAAGLRPGGLLAFSVNDLPGDATGEASSRFEAASESLVLPPDRYGTTWVTEPFVRDAAARACPGAAVRRYPRGILGSQDLYVLGLPPGGEAGWPEIGIDPGGTFEGARLEPDGSLLAVGWAIDEGSGAPARSVDLYLGTSLLGSAACEHERRDVVELLRREGAYARCGWSGVVTLPAVHSRSLDGFTVWARGAAGEPALLYAGTIDAACLRGAESVIRRLQQGR